MSDAQFLKDLALWSDLGVMDIIAVDLSDASKVPGGYYYYYYILREGRRLKMFEKKVLRSIFGTRREETTKS